MGFCYFGYACVNLAKNDPSIRDEALEEMRWLIEALQNAANERVRKASFRRTVYADQIHVVVCPWPFSQSGHALS